MKLISVKDQLPPDETMVIVSGGVAYYKVKEDAWYSLTGYDMPGKKIQWKVTHWMPLPEFPKSENI